MTTNDLEIYCVTNKPVSFIEGTNIFLAGVGKNKFNEDGVLFSISQSAFGTKIKPGSLVISGNLEKAAANQIYIKDDGYGNLYPTNATISQSGNSSLSSSAASAPAPSSSSSS